jgi:hypothetical protein
MEGYLLLVITGSSWSNPAIVTPDQGKYLPRIESALPITYLAFKILVQIPC